MKKQTITLVLFVIIPSFLFANLLPNGVVFRVKIEDNKVISKTSKINYKPISILSDTHAELGAFTDYILAQKAKSECKKSGISFPEIVAYFNNRKVSIDDAFTLLDNKNREDEKGLPMLNESQIDLALESVEKPDFYYTVQVGVFNAQQVGLFFDLPKTINEKVTDKGNYRYTYGRYYTVNDAKDALRMVKETGLEGSFITAYDDVERIPLARAMNMEEKYLLDAVAITK